MPSYQHLNVPKFDTFLRGLLLDKANGRRLQTFTRSVRHLEDWFDAAHPESEVRFDPRVRSAVKHKPEDLTKIARLMYLITWEWAQRKPTACVVYRATGTKVQMRVGQRVRYQPSRVLSSWSLSSTPHKFDLADYRAARKRSIVTTFQATAKANQILWTPNSDKVFFDMVEYVVGLHRAARSHGSDTALQSALAELRSAFERYDGFVSIPKEQEVTLYLTKPLPCVVTYSQPEQK